MARTAPKIPPSQLQETITRLEAIPEEKRTSNQKGQLTKAQNALEKLKAAANTTVPVAVGESTPSVGQPSESLFGLDFTQSELKLMEETENPPGVFEAFCDADVTKQPHTDGDVPGHFKIVLPQKGSSPLGSPSRTYANGVDDPRQTKDLASERPTAMEVDTPDEHATEAEPEWEPAANTTLPLQDGDVAVVAPHSSPSNNQDVVYSSTLSQLATKYEEEQDQQVGDELQSAAHALLLLAQSPDETDPVRFGATMALMQLWGTPQAALACSPVFSDMLQRIKSTLVEDAKRMQHDGVPCTDPRKVFTPTVPKPMDMARGMLQALSLDTALLTKEASVVLKPFISMIRTSVRLTLEDLPDCSFAPPEISGRAACDTAGASFRFVLNDTAFTNLIDALYVPLSKLPQACSDGKEWDLQCAANKINASATPDVPRPSLPTSLFAQPYQETIGALRNVQESRQARIDTLLGAMTDLVTDKDFSVRLPKLDAEDVMRTKLANIRVDGFVIPYEAETVDGKRNPPISSTQAKVMLAQERKACESLGINELILRVLANFEIFSRFNRWGMDPCQLGDALSKLPEADRPGYATLKALRNQRKRGVADQPADNGTGTGQTPKSAQGKRTKRAIDQTAVNSNPVEKNSDGSPPEQEEVNGGQPDGSPPEQEEVNGGQPDGSPPERDAELTDQQPTQPVDITDPTSDDEPIDRMRKERPRESDSDSDFNPGDEVPR